MKISIDNRLAAALVWSSALLSTACQRALEIVDDLQQPGSSGEYGPTSNPVRPDTCACGHSESLIPLSCDGRAVPLLDNDIVQATPDGSVVAFNLCDESTFLCEVFYWDGHGPARSIGDGFLYGLSASGSDVLLNGYDAGLKLNHLDGSSTSVPLDVAMGEGSLSASGDSVIGSINIEDTTFLARFDVQTGDVERLGPIDGSIARSYANREGTRAVGWMLPFDNDLSTFSAFRWSEQSGFSTEFPGVPANVGIWPESLSADGSAIAGRALPSQQHFVWSESDGYSEIAEASWRSETFISRDGTVVLGSLDGDGGQDNNPSSAFRWTRATGAVEVAPGTQNLAVAMSDDGNVIIANSWEEAQFDGATPLGTFIWDNVNGSRTLPEVLQARGANTNGWIFGSARALSADGKVLLGRGECGGVPTLYRLVLSD